MFCYWNFLPLIIYTFNNLLRFVRSAQFSAPIVSSSSKYYYYCCCFFSGFGLLFLLLLKSNCVVFGIFHVAFQWLLPRIPCYETFFFLPLYLSFSTNRLLFLSFFGSFECFELTLRNLRFYKCILCHLAIVTCCAHTHKYTFKNIHHRRQTRFRSFAYASTPHPNSHHSPPHIRLFTCFSWFASRLGMPECQTGIEQYLCVSVDLA